MIEECAISGLDDKEILWTNEFDSINNGLNIVEAGACPTGFNARNSKYSKIQILRVFSLLINTSKSHSEISKITKVTSSTICNMYAIIVG